MLPRFLVGFLLVFMILGQDGQAQNPQVTLGTSVVIPNGADPIPVLAAFDRPVSALSPLQINVTHATVVNFRQFAAPTHSPGSRPTFALGSWHGVAIEPDGSLAAWGDNGFGQLAAPAGNDFTAVAAGMAHTVALRADGSLAAWGMDFFGQIAVPPGTGYQAIAVGDFFSLALRPDGSLAAWGSNGNGECDVPAGNDFVAVAAGASHGLALRADHSLAAWGLNDWGQAAVPPGNDFVAIDAGSNFSLAQHAGGSLAAWGWNGNGLDAMPAATDFALVEAGGAHGLALRVDGSLVWWGAPEFTPGAAVTENFMGLAGGAYNSAAIRPDGTLAVWGLDFFGIGVPPAGLTVRPPLIAMALFDLAPTGLGAVSARVPAGACADAAGLPNDASNLLSFSSDVVGPEATLSTTAASSANAQPIPVTLTFNEPAVGFAIEDVTVSGATAALVGSEADTTFQLALTPSGEGPVTVSLPAGVCADAAGNLNSASNNLSVVYDVTAPASRLVPLKKRAGSAKIVSLPMTASDNLSPVTTALWVKPPQSRQFIDTGLRLTGTSGVFNYNFGNGRNGLYVFLTQATDAAGNTQPLGCRRDAIAYAYTGWRPAK